jgi:hypothetical protein
MRVSLFMALVVVAGCGSVSAKKMDASVGSGGDAAVDAATACPAGVTAMCSGDDLVTCDSQGNITNTQTCALGCDGNAKRCLKVDPSNGLATFLDDAATAPDLVLSGTATIDTDAGTIVDQSGARTQPSVTVDTGLPIGMFVIKAKSFATGGTVTVTGTRALAIVVDGPITISHVISVSAPLGGNGPGALPNDATGKGGNGGNGSTEGQSGGGGGGFGTAGGRGGTGGVPTVNGGNPGALSGNSTLIPLRGGSTGGHPGSTSASYGPGGGGGAIQLVSNTSITFAANGMISANGSGAFGPNNVLCLVNTPCGHGEGGGAGGGVLLEAPTLAMDATSGIFANGGGGTCGVTGTAQSGQNSTTPAAGQVCGGQTGNGGNGAAGATAAQNGGNTSGDNAVGGAGGGGLGRIRVNLKAGGTFSPAGTVSGALTAGAVSTR